ncbi:uncharacterized protein LOC115639706 [Gopherus evgoodei]|uniref:uncharacterized protein LOC115639706 n=1 Tax=Gopherus evgoodei TaxID=1825980 RepID=UPI0011CFE7B3|nr:uncharacterized protein LOC115639706 [Gopherus evgoodei]
MSLPPLAGRDEPCCVCVRVPAAGGDGPYAVCVCVCVCSCPCRPLLGGTSPAVCVSVSWLLEGTGPAPCVCVCVFVSLPPLAGGGRALLCVCPCPGCWRGRALRRVCVCVCVHVPAAPCWEGRALLCVCPCPGCWRGRAPRRVCVCVCICVPAAPCWGGRALLCVCPRPGCWRGRALRRVHVAEATPVGRAPERKQRDGETELRGPGLAVIYNPVSCFRASGGRLSGQEGFFPLTSDIGRFLCLPRKSWGPAAAGDGTPDRVGHRTLFLGARLAGSCPQAQDPSDHQVGEQEGFLPRPGSDRKGPKGAGDVGRISPLNSLLRQGPRLGTGRTPAGSCRGAKCFALCTGGTEQPTARRPGYSEWALLALNPTKSRKCGEESVYKHPPRPTPEVAASQCRVRNP